jgi:transcriptional regulator with XRE-family HTH domain
MRFRPARCGKRIGICTISVPSGSVWNLIELNRALQIHGPNSYLTMAALEDALFGRRVPVREVMPAEKRTGRSRAQDVDRYVGARMRQRRIMLGLTQHQMAELIGVTYQQAHKYEKGINRVAAGRLYRIAQALGVEVSYFYEGIGTADRFVPSPQQRMLLDLARNYLNIQVPEHQKAIVALTRALAGREDGGDLAA